MRGLPRPPLLPLILVIIIKSSSVDIISSSWSLSSISSFSQLESLQVILSMMSGRSNPSIKLRASVLRLRQQVIKFNNIAQNANWSEIRVSTTDRQLGFHQLKLDRQSWRGRVHCLHSCSGGEDCFALISTCDWIAVCILYQTISIDSKKKAAWSKHSVKSGQMQYLAFPQLAASSLSIETDRAEIWGRRFIVHTQIDQ